jgi:dipeptidyl aminopeptidase/acylaminoacyl peptidase
MMSSLAAELVYQLKGISDPVISPDGSRVVYTLSWVEGTGSAAENRSRLMLAGPEDGAGREFTQGNADGSPRFSSDGTMLAFLRARQSGEPRQVWAMKADGGEARQLTNAAKGVQEFAWSPDGLRIVYCADTEPAAGAAAGSQTEGPRVVEVNRLRYRHDLQGWRGDAHYHLFTVNLESGDSAQVTRGDWDDYGPVWSPDGRKIAFISGRRDDRDTRALTEAYVVDAQGEQAAECWSGGLASVGAVAWSPDSQRLVAVASEDPAGMVLWQGWLYVLEPGREPRRITNDSQRPALGGGPGAARQPEIRWTSGPDAGDGGRIIFLGERHGESHLFIACPEPVEGQAEGGAPRQLWGGGRLASGMSLDGNARRAAVASSTPSSPAELCLAALDGSGATTWADPNAAFRERHPAPPLEKFSIERAGYDIEGRLWFPPDFDANGSYPLVLDVHGGPNGAFYDSFVPWQQLLAGSGYLALAVNPRGSSTYGDDFMRAVLDDWGGEDYLDLMAALDHVCQRDYVDSARLGIHGYSYGGYMTGWAIGHTNRFRAAVIGAPCTNLYTMYGTSDIGISFGEPQWGGSVTDTPPEILAQKLLARSPITYAKDVDTPALLLHGESDARCPVAQSEEYFTALKRMGKTVEFVRFPGSNHAFPRTGHPKMREEYLARMLGWFDDWLR